MSYENLCMNCMKEIGTSEQCPHCHFHNDSLQLPPHLPMRTMIGKRYLVGAVQTSNGDGTTYIGYDTVEMTPVTIREFLPDSMTRRSQDSNDLVVAPGHEAEYTALLGSFMDLWSKLVKMRGLSALISVNTILEENNTAYAISEHVEGAQSLRDYLLSTKNGYINWETARVMFMPVLSTLATLHSSGIIHREISPDTLYVYPDHKIRIAGFSIPECRTVNGGLTTEVFPGYSPVELLGVQSAAGPWTDIYSFAAVLYRALIGKAPIDAMVRMKDDQMMIPAKFAEQLPDYVINGLVNALQVLPEDRTRSIDRFRAELSSSQVAEFASEYEEEEKARKRERFSQPEKNNLDDTQVIGGLPGAGQNNMRFNIPHQETEEEARRAAAAEQEQAARQAQARQAAQARSAQSQSSQQARPKRSSSSSSAKTVLLTVAIVVLAALLIFLILFFGVFGGGAGRNSRIGDATTESMQDGMVMVPQFVGQQFDDLGSDVLSNFNIVTKYVDSSSGEEGTIIAQSVSAYRQVPKGTTITLTVSRGSDQITMVGVNGQTSEQARATLEQLGFNVQIVTKLNPGGNTSGTVASADLTPGRQYDRGTTVTLQVWGNPVGGSGSDTGETEFAGEEGF